MSNPDHTKNKHPAHSQTDETSGSPAMHSQINVRGGNVHAPVTGVNLGSITHISYLADEKRDVRGLTNPYIGLRSFTYNDRAIYAGHKSSIATSVSRLTTPGKQQVLLFITGASGSGKSSLAQAGLIPALETHYQQRGVTARHCAFRPSKYPLAMLVDALQQMGMPANRFDDQQPETFVHFVQQQTSFQQVNLLVIDQFEELYAQSEPGQRDALFAILQHLPSFEQVRTHIIITLRSDYLPKLFAQASLYEVYKQGIDLRAMTEEELQTAIQQPLWYYYPDGIKQFEPALLQRLASHAAADAAYLPLLQVTLEDLWRRGSLTLAAYDTLTDALRRHAEAVYRYVDYDGAQATERPQTDRQTILDILLDLVDVSLDDRQHRDVRRRRTALELHQADPSRKHLMNDLCQARLLSKGLEMRDEQQVEVVDIIHETLIFNWERLSTAIAAQRQALQHRVRFELALKEWKAAGRHDRYLLQGVRLTEAVMLAQHNDVALRNPEAQELLHRSYARRQQELAQELVNHSLVIQANQPALLERSVLLAIEAMHRSPTLAAHQALASNLSLLMRLASNYAPGRQIKQVVVSPDSRIIAVNTEDEQTNTHILYLWHLYEARQPIPLTHVNVVTQVAFDTQSNYIVTISGSGYYTIKRTPLKLHVWDIATVSERVSIDMVDQHITFVTFLPDSRSVLTVSDPSARPLELDTSANSLLARGKKLLFGEDVSNPTVRIWDLSSGQEATHLPFDDEVHALAVSPDGTYLATAAKKDKTVSVWERATTRKIATLQHEGVVNALAFHPDGTRLATASADQTARLWLLPDGQEDMCLHHEEGLTYICFSHDGQSIGTISYNGRMIHWNLANKAKNGQMMPGRTAARVFSPDLRTAATLKYDQTVVQVWDIASGRETGRAVHPQYGENITISPDGRFLVTTSQDGIIRLWEISRLPIIRQFRQPSQVESIAFSSDGSVLAGGSADGTTYVWEVDSGALQAHYATEKAVKSVTFSPDGHYLAIASGDGVRSFADNVAVVYARASGQEILRVNHANEIQTLAFSPDGRYLATAGGTVFWNFRLSMGGESTEERPDTLRVWELSSGQICFSQVQSTQVGAVAFSPDGRYLVAGESGASDGLLCVWEIASGCVVLQRAVSHVVAIGFSADSRLLLIVGAQGNREWWDITCGEPITLPPDTLPEIVVPPFSRYRALTADGLFLAIAAEPLSRMNETNVVPVWNTAYQQEVARIQTDAPATTVAFSPDSRLIATTHGSHIQLWIWWPDDLIQYACSMLSRNLSWEEWQQYMGSEEAYRCTCANLPTDPGVSPQSGP
jgi:WD40 repeat protein/energy-coupling factor transporter ATP-binding protein EcfA2